MSQIKNKFLAQVPADTLKGNNTGSTANVTDLTTSQVNTMLGTITSLTGDVTASGPGAAAATLATVNSNVGSFTNANITVNAKGLITAASNGTGGSASLSSTSYSQITASTLNTSSPGALMIFKTLNFNDFAGSYSTTTGLFTVPNTGRYLINIQTPTLTGFNSGDSAAIFIQINGSGAAQRIGPVNFVQSSSLVSGYAGSSVIALTSGQTVGFFLQTSSQNTLTVSDGSSNVTYFTITQVH